MLERIFRRGISMVDVISALTNGEIIEQYPTDYPFPSCLVLGRTKAGKALHIVCGSNGDNYGLSPHISPIFLNGQKILSGGKINDLFYV